MPLKSRRRSPQRHAVLFSDVLEALQRDAWLHDKLIGLMISSKAASLIVASSGLTLLWACTQKGDDGFGGGGSSFDPVTDTGPWYSTEDTGETGDTGASPDTGSGSDTGETDSDTAGDTARCCRQSCTSKVSADASSGQGDHYRRCV